MLQPSGAFFAAYEPEWRPADRAVEVGILLQAASILIKASNFVSVEDRSAISEAARSLVDICLRDLWGADARGFPAKAVVRRGRLAVVEDQGIWWVQAEGLRALVKLACGDSEQASAYLDHCLRLWSFIQSELVDPRHKGWCASPSSPRSAKAHEMKDASHEVRALTECIRELDGQAGRSLATSSLDVSNVAIP